MGASLSLLEGACACLNMYAFRKGMQWCCPDQGGGRREGWREREEERCVCGLEEVDIHLPSTSNPLKKLAPYIPVNTCLVPRPPVGSVALVHPIFCRVAPSTFFGVQGEVFCECGWVTYSRNTGGIWL